MSSLTQHVLLVFRKPCHEHTTSSRVDKSLDWLNHNNLPLDYRRTSSAIYHRSRCFHWFWRVCRHKTGAQVALPVSHRQCTPIGMAQNLKPISRKSFSVHFEDHIYGCCEAGWSCMCEKRAGGRRRRGEGSFFYGQKITFYFTGDAIGYW